MMPRELDWTKAEWCLNRVRRERASCVLTILSDAGISIEIYNDNTWRLQWRVRLSWGVSFVEGYGQNENRALASALRKLRKVAARESHMVYS